jgi:outer membrane lipopolysaccharide assembly protein LptE/RlpB
LHFNWIFILSVNLLLMPTLGCGYRFAGNGGLPGGIQTLSVPVFENSSSETGVEIVITNAMISELGHRRPGTVVDPRDAQATLHGAITSLTWDTVTRKGLNTASERRIYVTISLSLVDAGGDVLWKQSGLNDKQVYAVVEGNKPATVSNRRDAFRKLSLRLAEKAYWLMTDQF